MTSKSLRRFRITVFGVLGLSLAACSAAPPAEVLVLEDESAIEFSAVVDTDSFRGSVEETGGYHLIVWRDGGAAEKALFRAAVSDTAVLDGLEALGAVPGNALRVESWEARYDESSWRPDQVLEGPPMAVLVKVRGRERPLELHEILDDFGGSGFDMRFGGHRGNISEWRSGCVVCLYSCPGSKVGNAQYTVRDYVRGKTPFRIREGILPKNGSQVTIRLELVDRSAAETTE